MKAKAKQLQLRKKLERKTNVATSLIVDIIIPHNYNFIYTCMKRKKTKEKKNTHLFITGK